MSGATLKGIVNGQNFTFGDIDDQITFSGTVSASTSAGGTYVYTAYGDKGDWQATKIDDGNSGEGDTSDENVDSTPEIPEPQDPVIEDTDNTDAIDTTISWQVAEVAQTTTPQQQLSIQSAWNDQIRRIYAVGDEFGGQSNVVNEFGFNVGLWNLSPIQAGDTASLLAYCIGNGRNDGVTRIYAAGFEMLEFTHLANSWDAVQIKDYSGWPDIAVLGDGHNDGADRIYISTNDNKVVEYQLK